MAKIKPSTSEIVFAFADNGSEDYICVCCLAHTARRSMIQPYDNLGVQELYSEMLMQCFSVNIMDQVVDIKLMICEQCSDKLRDALQFKQLILNSIKYLTTQCQPISKKKDEENQEVKTEQSEDDFEYEMADDNNVSEIKNEADDVDTKQENVLNEDAHEDDLNLKDIKQRILRSKSKSKLKKRKLSNSTKTLQSSFLDAGFVPFKYKNEDIICIMCDTVFKDFDLLKGHVYNQHSTKEISTGMKHMKKRGNLDRFRLRKERVTCTNCSTLIDSYDDLKRHFDICQMKKERLPYKLDRNRLDCPICGVKFLNYQTLNVHMNEHYPNFVCESCGKAFASKERLKSHVRNHVSGDFPCKYCGKIFDKITKREHHIAKIHTAGLRYICPKCHIPIKSFYMRQKHLAEEHNQELKQYKCKLCPMSYITPGHLNGHVRRDHLKERNHKCNKCDSAFYTKNALDMHMVKHDGERIYNCEVCQKSYQRYKTLREHMRIHTNDRRFACEICGRSFTQKCTLKGHLKVHEKEIGQKIR